ncbi:hypothetical protein PLEOSDRAFT_161876 [Pleurotus ostreatus PC15]|uniref:Uncharacterized protein n=1 Tax=Pleurotus ostreatus (strain PC15) TaxID=1137138 RepID=A0A067NKM3_PLEO1|nr:hypothetical protein PLEOSDRAFT_161876 [Pleurotus ostreatus PC15]
MEATVPSALTQNKRRFLAQRLPDWITPPGGVEFGTEVETNDGDLPSYNLRVSLSSVLTCNTVDAFPAKFSLEELTL